LYSSSRVENDGGKKRSGCGSCDSCLLGMMEEREEAAAWHVCVRTRQSMGSGQVDAAQVPGGIHHLSHRRCGSVRRQRHSICRVQKKKLKSNQSVQLPILCSQALTCVDGSVSKRAPAVATRSLSHTHRHLHPSWPSCLVPSMSLACFSWHTRTLNMPLGVEVPGANTA
jgi:hypothetical protein